MTLDTPVSPCLGAEEAMNPETERGVLAEPVSEPLAEAAELGMPRADASE